MSKYFRFKNVIILVSEISSIELRERFQEPKEFELCIVSKKGDGMFGISHHVMQVPCLKDEGESALNEITELLK